MKIIFGERNKVLETGLLTGFLGRTKHLLAPALEGEVASSEKHSDAHFI